VGQIYFSPTPRWPGWVSCEFLMPIRAGDGQKLRDLAEIEVLA
jgi:hypothetical protein